MGKKTKPPERTEGKITFRYLAEVASRSMGSSYVFIFAVVLIIVWAVSGFHFRFDETWQLLINTGTTIGTFLMVILVQNTQTREYRAIQLKLDELLYGTENTRDSLIRIEEQSDAEIDEFKDEFKKLREEYIAKKKKDAE
jgi:low affinity Fe/Cu permease